MQSSSDESRILLAIEAIRRHEFLSIRAAARAYSVDHTKLSRRLKGQPARRDIQPNSRKLTELEESVIVQHILDLDSRRFPPRLSGVEDMANRLLADRSASKVGKNWASTFVRRHLELRTRFSRKYDYHRALCEDPGLIQGWFTLVQNTIAKYGISEADIYNFDETGFLMGVISSTIVVTSSERRSQPALAQPGNREWVTVIQGVNSQGWAIPPFIVVAGQYHLSAWYEYSELPNNWVIATSKNGWTTNELGIEWVQHFDKHTKGRTTGVYRLLVLDGHESHHSTDFELFCKDNNIITLCMPPHSSHLLQPLDVGCFGPLKRAYSRQIENLMRVHISHITKVEFFLAFKAAFTAAMTEENIRGSFRGSGLVPLDPGSVISKLDLKLKTPTPSGSPCPPSTPWVSKTPQNPLETVSQSEFIKGRIAQHQHSSPTPIYSALDQFTKGAQTMIHSVALLTARVKALEEANHTLSKRRRAKKARFREGGSLTVQDGQDLLDQKAVDEQMMQEIRDNSGRKRRVETRERRCGNCGKTGHNTRTCEKHEETS
jgi:DDE superfamily endonuclease/Tc5 transposase DNA-binding domain/helix-turn-helix, Psq domain